MKVAAADAGNIIHLGDIDTRSAQMRNASRIVTATEGRVCLLRRTEIVFHTEVNLNGSTLEPASTALGKLGRFWQLCHAQDISIKTPSRLFSACGHSKLDVIDRSEWSVGHRITTIAGTNPSLLHS